MIKLKCKICNKKITSGSTKGYCKECYLKTLKRKTHPNWKGGLPKCIDCGKELSTRSKKYNPKRCKSCVMKLNYRRNPKLNKGKNHYWFGKKRPEQSKLMKIIMKNRDKRFRPKANKSLIHHIDLDKFNNKKSNRLKTTFKIHTALHQRGYDYLVKIGLIRKYIKWFFKTYKGSKR